MRSAEGGRPVGGLLLRRWPEAAGLVLVGLLVGLVLGVAAPAAVAVGTEERGWPLAGPREVGRPFDPPAVRYAAGHRGVDLPSSPGAPVLAAAAGRVTYAGLVAGRGVVVVRHGELRTTYEPVGAAVPVGGAVEAGSVLGRLETGHLGCAAPACLHWGLKRGEDYLDPVRWVLGGPVRLLPVAGAVPLPGAADALPAAGPGSGVGPVGVAGPADAEPGGAAAAQGRVPAPAGRTGPVEPEGGAPTADAGAGAVLSAPVLSAPVLSAPAEAEPRWSLRSTEVPLGAAAVAALVAGIGLLARPRPPAPEPVTGAAAVPVPEPVEEDAGPGALVDLDAARVRRRSG